MCLSFCVGFLWYFAHVWNILFSTGGGNLCGPIHSEFGRSVWIMYLLLIQKLSLVSGCDAYMYLMAILIGPILYMLYCDRNSMYVMRSAFRSARNDISLTASRAV